jgi:hypothetical protein
MELIDRESKSDGNFSILFYLAVSHKKFEYEP